MKTTLHLHTQFNVGTVDPRIFGGFLEHMGRAVYEGVYDPVSKLADEFGCRKDVLAALKRLRFSAMRYPGGNFVSGYHWQDAVGPRSRRPTVRDLAWQSLETNQFGPNEFLGLSRRMNWTPMMAVNLGTGTPEEARNWVEYCNIESGSKWSDLRIEHGYSKSHDIKLWCLGNEMDGPWQIGHVPAADYAIKAQQTARMMRMVDPSLELVVCGSSSSETPTYLAWDQVVLDHCRDTVEYISLHRYVGNQANDTPDFLAVTNSIDEQIEATDAVCRTVQSIRRLKRRVYLSFDEWNVWYRTFNAAHMDGGGKFAPHLIEEEYNLEDALVAAGFLNSFIRHADCVKIANLAQIVNVIAPILTRGQQMVLQTIFYPIEMMSARRTGTSLRIAVDGPAYESKRYGVTKYLDASAILNGRQLSVFACNRSVEESMDLEVQLGDAQIAKLLNGEIVTGADPKVSNTFEKPDAVVAQTFKDATIRDGTAILKLPPLSMVAATMELA